MATVPRSSRTVGPSVTPSVNIKTDIPIEAVGGNQSTPVRQLQSLQADAQKIYLRERDRARKIRYMELDEMSVKKASELELEAQKKKLAGANGVADVASEALRKYNNELLLQTDDEKVREMLGLSFPKREESVKAGLQRYEFAQMEAADKIRFQSYTTTLSDSAMKNWGNPEGLQSDLASGRKEIREFYEEMGADKGTQDLMVMEWTSPVHVEVISKLQENMGTKVAMQYYEKNKHEILAKDAKRIQASMKESNDRDKSIELADKIRAEHDTLVEQRKAVRALPPEYRDMVDARISRMAAQDEADKKATENAQTQEAIGAIEANLAKRREVESLMGAKSEEAGLTMGAIRQLTPRDLWPELSREQKEALHAYFNPPQHTDPRKWAELRNLRWNNPQALADMPDHVFYNMTKNFSRYDRARAETLQDSARKYIMALQKDAKSKKEAEKKEAKNKNQTVQEQAVINDVLREFLREIDDKDDRDNLVYRFSYRMDEIMRQKTEASAAAGKPAIEKFDIDVYRQEAEKLAQEKITWAAWSSWLDSPEQLDKWSLTKKQLEEGVGGVTRWIDWFGLTHSGIKSTAANYNEIRRSGAIVEIAKKIREKVLNETIVQRLLNDRQLIIDLYNAKYNIESEEEFNTILREATRGER